MVKYAIELSTCGESGTYMAFQEIWQGMPKQLFRLDQEGEIVPPDPETPLHYHDRRTSEKTRRELTRRVA